MLLLEKLPHIPTNAPIFLLGTTLIHEYVHVPYALAGNWDPGPTEGKAYGIERFFAERLGDKERLRVIAIIGPKKGDEDIMNVSTRVMKALYEVIDTGASKSPSLQGVNAERAREMSVEFISKNKEDFSDGLNRFLSSEFKGYPGYYKLQ